MVGDEDSIALVLNRLHRAHGRLAPRRLRLSCHLRQLFESGSSCCVVVVALRRGVFPLLRGAVGLLWWAQLVRLARW